MADQPTIAASSNNTNVPANYGKIFGDSGTAIMGGIITGEEYNTRLQGKNALRMFDIMRKSEEAVRAALQIVKLPLMNQSNTIVGYDDKDEAKFRARFLERELFHRNVKWDKLKREGLTFADFGHSLAEVTYEITTFEGRTMIGIKDIGFRKQTSILAWETRQKLPGITQQLITTKDNKDSLRDIIRQKLIVWTNDQEGDNYEGISLLRYAFKSWDMADKLGLVHAIGLEKMAIPTPVLGVPASGANQTDIDSAVESLKQYRSNEKGYIKKPAGWELDVFDLSGQSIKELLPALQHYEMKILLSVLGQFLMLGTSGSGGSRAVSEDHSKLFMLSEEAFSKTFNGSIQNDLINQLEYLNYSDVEDTGYSQLKSSAVKEDDMVQIANFVQALKGAAMITPTFETEQHLRKIAKLPELPKDYEADYDKQREMRLNPPLPTKLGPDGKPLPEDPNNPDNPKPTDPPKDPAKDDPKNPPKPDLKASIEAARRAKERLISDILV